MRINKKDKKPEILSPAGSYDSLRAAVENGADAVYLGGSLFNARIQADNFDKKQLEKGIHYAHSREVNIYVAMNTLISDREMQKALDYAKYLYEIGADALIVQDLGFLSLMKQYIPDLPLHMSTQGTIYNLEGVRSAEKLGCSRVVPARELSLEEIKHITDHCDGEIETFVHGALCFSYSGQCLLSQDIGGRSGNRGICAQPCRLPYTRVASTPNNIKNLETGYFLSPKDLSMIAHLDKLCEAGISSFKIEGRMKSPEYVAVVTSIYRKYLDLYWSEKGPYEVAKEDLKELAQVFNRGNFTTGYYFGNIGDGLITKDVPKNKGIHIGAVSGRGKSKGLIQIVLDNGEELNMGDIIEIRNHDEEIVASGMTTFLKEDGESHFTIGDFFLEGTNALYDKKKNMKHDMLIYKMKDCKLSNKAKRTFAENAKMTNNMIPLSGHFSAACGLPIELSLWDESGETVKVQSEKNVERAIKNPSSSTEIFKQLSKTGGTPFILKEESVEIDMEPNLFISVSDINMLRRTALEALQKKKENKYADRQKRTYGPYNYSLITDMYVKKEFQIESAKKSLYIVNEESFLGNNILQEDKYDRVYIPINAIIDLKNETDHKKQINSKTAYLLDLCASGHIECMPIIPNITKGNMDEIIKKYFDHFIDLYNVGKISGMLLGNIGWADEFIKKGMPVYADASFNIYNVASMLQLKELGLKGGVMSRELSQSGAFLNSIDGFEVEIEVSGKPVVMTTAHILPKGYLIDRKAAKLEVISRDDSSSIRSHLDLKNVVIPKLSELSIDYDKLNIEKHKNPGVFSNSKLKGEGVGNTWLRIYV